MVVCASTAETCSILTPGNMRFSSLYVNICSKFTDFLKERLIRLKNLVWYYLCKKFTFYVGKLGDWWIKYPRRVDFATVIGGTRQLVHLYKK